MAEVKWLTEEVLEAERNKPTPLEEISKQQTDLVFTLMLNGVI